MLFEDIFLHTQLGREQRDCIFGYFYRGCFAEVNQYYLQIICQGRVFGSRVSEQDITCHCGVFALLREGRLGLA